jgi:AraC family transcriptional regulator of adaptative response/methylated-DNA-[protein]-cysteine methyltransferase
MESTDEIDERHWNAVRERRSDGGFVFAVRTTGIYCRSGCTARTPLRTNVVFFGDAKAARAAGFRACKRCGPDDAQPDAERVRAIAHACMLLDRPEPPLLDEVAAAVGMSRFHFQRVFRASVGVTPGAYVRGRREARLRSELADGASVTDAVLAAGFGSMTRAYAADAVGMHPSRARIGGAGEVIAYTCAPCSLGRVLVATTMRGICAIALGDDDAALIADLARRFSRAELVRDDAALHASLTAVLALVDDPALAFDLPLDVRGTAFQRRVWTALRALPPGTPVRYGEVARAIGAPKAARAVGAACGANALALAIPCHRVVGSDGALTGYRWGAERKRALLEREASR